MTNLATIKLRSLLEESMFQQGEEHLCFTTLSPVFDYLKQEYL